MDTDFEAARAGLATAETAYESDHSDETADKVVDAMNALWLASASSPAEIAIKVRSILGIRGAIQDTVAFRAFAQIADELEALA